MDRKSLIDVPSRRSIAASEFELRGGTGNDLHLTGYASIFDAPYDIYGGPSSPMGWSETVDKRAFDKTLRESPDLHLLINHEGMPLARTKSGTLRLSTDSKGLLCEADLDRSDPDVQRLESKMTRGDMDEMSFAFRVKADDWSADDTKRNLTEVSLHKGDVSVVNFGANPATSAQLRSLCMSLSNMDEEKVFAEARSLGIDRLAEVRDMIAGLVRRLEPPIKVKRVSGTLTLSEIRELGDSAELPR